MIESSHYSFPHPNTSDAQGLLAMGGDLEPERLLQAYKQGIFPWYNSGNPILWWSPNPRLIIKPGAFKSSKSLQKKLKQHDFSFSFDKAFAEVILACATENKREDNTWINHDMIQAYKRLHEQGYAHSLEIWREGMLVGGLYGLSLGAAFFGESMFHRIRDASKIAVYYLSEVLFQNHFDFIDCQIPNKHLISLGAEVVSRAYFLNLLEHSLKKDTLQGSWLNRF